VYVGSTTSVNRHPLLREKTISFVCLPLPAQEIKNLTPQLHLPPRRCPLAVAAHGLRRGRRDGHHLPLSPAPLLLYPAPPPAPCRLPIRRRLQTYVSIPPLPARLVSTSLVA